MSQKPVGIEPRARLSSKQHPWRLNIFQGASLPLDPRGCLCSLLSTSHAGSIKATHRSSPLLWQHLQITYSKKSWDEQQPAQEVLTGQTHACNDLAKKCIEMYLSPAWGLFGATDGTAYREATRSARACSQLTEGHMVAIAWQKNSTKRKVCLGGCCCCASPRRVWLRARWHHLQSNPPQHL